MRENGRKAEILLLQKRHTFLFDSPKFLYIGSQLVQNATFALLSPDGFEKLFQSHCRLEKYLEARVFTCLIHY